MHLPKKSKAKTRSRYEALGLKDLPFPNEPVVDLYSPDPRRNGTIYAESPVQHEIDKFEQLLIRPDDFLNRVRLAYLWSKGDQESGRGMGKTALLRYFRQRINKDWGNTEFKGNFSAVVIYVSFPSQVNIHYMKQLAWSALVDICQNQELLKASRAVLRTQALTEAQVNEVITNADGSENNENLLDDTILQAKGIVPSDLDKIIAEQLVKEGVQSEKVANALARGEFENYLRSLRKDKQLRPFYVPRYTNLVYARTLLFDDIVHYLWTAGFDGGYLFIDDIENLVDQMTKKDRLEFAKEFAICTVRPGYANTAHNFFSCVLTTHQQASVGLSQAWGEAGLSAFARLDPTSPNSVELPLPSKNQARDIIIAHLDYYRINTADKGTIKPFTEEGINALLTKLHPRILVSNAAKVILYAVQQGINAIDAVAVKAAIDNSATQSTPDFSEGIEDAL
jgi:hypothetical protein